MRRAADMRFVGFEATAKWYVLEIDLNAHVISVYIRWHSSAYKGILCQSF